MGSDNNSAREEILGKIRAAQQQKKSTDNDTKDVSRLMKNPESKIIKHANGHEKFLAKLIEVKATYAIIKDRTELVREVHEYVARHAEKSTITLANNDELSALDWRDKNVTTHYEPKTISVSVTTASFGIEDTGTLVLKSSPESPTGMNFLPDYHIVALDSVNIVRSMDDVWLSLHASGESMPRTINMITGPSKTADIEQDIQFGAHGPKYLHVILMVP